MAPTGHILRGGIIVMVLADVAYWGPAVLRWAT
jgi:hypothetical protein